ncbi:MAG: alpha/beta hydrolase [Candidatus Cloacimonetes bacterium]|nr:alpha/beta hydrolase [Candidatus Cloacimonadota bacterium]
MKSAILLFLVILIIAGCKPLVNKMAFHPDTKKVFSTDQLPENVQEIFIETKDHVKIHSYFILDEASEKILIYFHGNAGNICQRLPDLMQLNSLGTNVFGVSYRGYGKSQGKPNEKGIYLDGKAALNYVIQKLGFAENNIIILGRSIGSTVAIHITQNKNINGLILVSPLTNGKEQAKVSGLGFISFLSGKSFDNIGKIINISCPILIIHGTQDEVIPFEMGKMLFDKAKSKKQFVGIESAGHNDLSTKYQESYWTAISEFIKN